MTNQTEKPANSRMEGMGVWIALGAGLGAALGAALDDMGVGVGIGVAIGVALGAGFSPRSNRSQPGDGEQPATGFAGSPTRKGTPRPGQGASMQNPGVQFVASILGYAALLVLSIVLIKQMDNDLLKALIALLPVIPALYVLRSITRGVALHDELERRIMLESLIFSLAGTAVVALTVSLLENAGLVQPNWTWLVPVICALWLVGQAMAGRKYR